MAEWQDGYWWSKDGLRLHYRDYPAPARSRQLPIICLPGLTRNARDFADLADRLAGKRRLILAELRGRGESAAAKDPMSYDARVYVEDIGILIEELGLDRFILFGTSLGGMLSMLLINAYPGKVAGVLLNDIGPTIESGGLNRIRSYVGRGSSFPTWLHAARGLSETHRIAYPDFALDDWLAMAKRLCRLTSAGRIVLDYDSALAEPLKAPGGELAPDLWPLLDALAPVPSLLTRGKLSDILSAETADRMAAALPLMERVELDRVGHTPLLTEPECEAAIDRLLARIAKAG
jgi:pimeloyl-ACP methyl ester carboxylesterase